MAVAKKPRDAACFCLHPLTLWLLVTFTNSAKIERCMMIGSATNARGSIITVELFSKYSNELRRKVFSFMNATQICFKK